ncbi:MAG TPA: hypothetical protein VJS38_17825 [Phenylobacterium sp.]|uniref:hypothetical protein n=1 Tax=Phenylobacterium sp. TaxID=1871053 RepID=UPI002B4A9AED|nr:hypothetical protein [Phenylobacterium sp.]HKR90030.1 hypothetical protein [Phenylobacterium sp.]
MDLGRMGEMDEDRSLFGPGRYPDTGPLAVLARLGFLASVTAIIVAVYLPSSMVPRFARSHYLEHFAAFYVALLAALAAMPRGRLRRVASGFVIFATALESSHLLGGAMIEPLVMNWVADLGGLAAAIAPIVVERYRRRFPPTIRTSDEAPPP